MEKSKKPKTKVYASCEHDYVSYKDLHRLCSKQHTYIKNQDKVLNVLKDRLREYHEKHSDCLEKNQELLQAHHEITRAYNGLHEMGKFAEELGIDIKKHNAMLPESGEYNEFTQNHQLLESGKVNHTWTIKKKKKDVSNDS